MTNSMTEKEKNKQVRRLQDDVNLVYRHTRKNSYKTREIYYKNMLRFIDYLPKHFGVTTLSNIQDKHIINYGKFLIKEGYSLSTVKSRLVSIRYYMEFMPRQKYEISKNNVLVDEILKQEETV